MKRIDIPILKQLPYPVLIVASLTLGMAPFSPQPHLIEKLLLLKSWMLVKPLDIFDLVLHATPIILLLLKFFCEGIPRKT
ncbi:MAG: RND transporter [Desulfuromonas sp.]|nr:MAG: RND transporter [Desulfuromonas sp.]